MNNDCGTERGLGFCVITRDRAYKKWSGLLMRMVGRYTVSVQGASSSRERLEICDGTRKMGEQAWDLKH